MHSYHLSDKAQLGNNSAVSCNEIASPSHSPLQCPHSRNLLREQIDKNAAPAIPKHHDIWAAVLFWTALTATVALFIYCVAQAMPIIDTPSVILKRGYLHVFLAIFASSILLTMMYTICLYKFPIGMIKVSLLGSALLSILAAVPILFTKAPVACLAPLALATSVIAFYFFFRSRTAFSAECLRNSIEVLSLYPGTIYLAISMIAMTVPYAGLWLYTCIMSWRQFENVLICVLLVFQLLWTLQVISHCLYTTVSGVFATHYFVVGSEHAMRHLTVASARRTITYSFGSIAFGSLFLGPVQTFWFVLKVLNVRGSRVEGLSRHFNYYALTYIAIFGKPYIQAAKDAWELTRKSGVEALENTNIVGFTLLIAVTTIGLVCLGLSISISLTFKNYSCEEVVIFAMLSLFLGTLFMAWICLIVQSGVTTTFLCYAEDPDAFKRAKLDIYCIFEDYKDYDRAESVVAPMPMT